VIYYILSQYELVDYNLVNAKLWDGGYTKYISFKETDSNLRLGTLYSNNARNIKGKYKVLENVLVSNVVEIKKKS